jgi:hypothetical protein
LALLGLAIGLLANLTTEYNRVIKFSGNKDQILTACRSLEFLGRAVERSTEIIAPEPLESQAVRLELRSVQVSEDRFTGWSWKPDQPLETSTFFVLDGHLMSAEGDDDPSPQILARDLAGFAVSRPTDSLLEIEISVADRQNVKTYSLKAHKWVR